MMVCLCTIRFSGLGNQTQVTQTWCHFLQEFLTALDNKYCHHTGRVSQCCILLRVFWIHLWSTFVLLLIFMTEMASSHRYTIPLWYIDRVLWTIASNINMYLRVSYRGLPVSPIIYMNPSVTHSASPSFFEKMHLGTTADVFLTVFC